MGFKPFKVLKSVAKVALPAALSAIPVVGPALAQGASSFLNQQAANNQYKSSRKQFLADREFNIAEKLEDRRRFVGDQKRAEQRAIRYQKDQLADDRAYAEERYAVDRGYYEEQKLGDRAYQELQQKAAQGYDETRVQEGRDYAERINREMRQQYLQDQMEAPSRTVEAARAAGINPLTLLGAGAVQQPLQPQQIGAPSTINGGQAGPAPGYNSPSFSAPLGGGQSAIGGGAAAFTSSSNFNQAGYAPLSTVDMITGAVAEAADYLSPERTAQRDNIILRNELMRVELDQQAAKAAPSQAPAPTRRPSKRTTKVAKPAQISKPSLKEATKGKTNQPSSTAPPPQFVDGPQGDRFVKASSAANGPHRATKYEDAVNLPSTGELQIGNSTVTVPTFGEEQMEIESTPLIAGSILWHQRDHLKEWMMGTKTFHSVPGGIKERVQRSIKEKIDDIWGGGDVLTTPSLQPGVNPRTGMKYN